MAPPFRLASEDCIACGACAAVCPVGTIVIREHPDEIEISPFKARVKLRRCAECATPLGSERVKEALSQRGGPNLVEILAGEELCLRCKRRKLAEELTAAVPAGGPAGPARR